MASTGPPNDPLSTFALSVFTINGLLMRAGENATRPLGQTSARWQVLGRAGYQPQTVAQMARDMGSSRQSVQYIVNRLLKEGLVELKDNSLDKRAKLVALTPKGAEVLSAIYARDKEWSKQILAKLDQKQLQDVAKVLNDISDIFDTHMSQDSSHENRS